MLKVRVLTALIGGPIFLGLSYMGGVPFLVMTFALGSLGYSEFVSLLHFRGLKPCLGPGLLSGAALLLGLHSPAYRIVLLGVVLACWCVWKLVSGNRYSILDWWATLLGSCYIFGLLGFWVALRAGNRGWEAFLLLVCVVWASDTAAYFAGRAWGRRKLWPRISPGKTWVGLVSGILASLMIGALFGHFLGIGFIPGAVAGLAGSVAGQAGDLVESAFKRFAGAKDSGRLIPGHGGILDRFDSLMLAAPAVFLVIRAFPT